MLLAPAAVSAPIRQGYNGVMNLHTHQASADYYAILGIACTTSRCPATSRPALCFMHDVVAPDVALHDDSTLGVPTVPGLGVAPDPAALAAVTER